MGDFLGGIGPEIMKALQPQVDTLDRRDSAVSDLQKQIEALSSFEMTPIGEPEVKRTPAKTVMNAIADALHALGRGVNQPMTDFSGQFQARKERQADRSFRQKTIEASRADRTKVAALQSGIQGAHNRVSSAEADVRTQRASDRAAAQEQARMDADERRHGALMNQRKTEFRETMAQSKSEAAAKAAAGSKSRLREQMTERTISEFEGFIFGGVDDAGNTLPGLKQQLESLKPEERAAAIATARKKFELMSKRPMDDSGIDYVEDAFDYMEEIISEYERDQQPLDVLTQTSGGSADLDIGAPLPAGPKRAAVGPGARYAALEGLLSAAGSGLDKLTGIGEQAEALRHAGNNPAALRAVIAQYPGTFTAEQARRKLTALEE